jgi:hypothetical protein
LPWNERKALLDNFGLYKVFGVENQTIVLEDVELFRPSSSTTRRGGSLLQVGEYMDTKLSPSPWMDSSNIWRLTQVVSQFAGWFIDLDSLDLTELPQSLQELCLRIHIYDTVELIERLQYPSFLSSSWQKMLEPTIKFGKIPTEQPR